MRHTKLLPTAIILGFCGLLSACAESASSGAGPDAPLPPDYKAEWPVGITSLDRTLLAKVVTKGVPEVVANLAFNKYDQFAQRVKNTDYITIIDFTRHSGKPRLWMINTKTAAVDALNVAHGAGSDPGNSGVPRKFSNVPDSHMTSLGAYLVAEKYQSTKFGTALKMDGLENTNDMARERAIVMHSAKYVNTSRSLMGMSWGCPAISLQWIAKALQRLNGGSFLYAFGNPALTNPALDDLQIQQLMLNPAYKWVDESEEAPVEGIL